MKHTKGKRLNIRFDKKIKLEFHGARLTSECGLLAYWELDEALVTSDNACEIHKGWSKSSDMQSVYHGSNGRGCHK